MLTDENYETDDWTNGQLLPTRENTPDSPHNNNIGVNLLITRNLATGGNQPMTETYSKIGDPNSHAAWRRKLKAGIDGAIGV